MKKTAPEFSRPLDLGDLSRGAKHFTLTAKPEERAALAKRFDLLDLALLEATVSVGYTAAESEIKVTGNFHAKATQRCVVTLEPVPVEIAEPIAQRFSLAPPKSSGPELDLASEDLDEAEPLGPEGLDLGELVAQFLAVALPPYPRKAGVEVKLASEPSGPFAVLKDFKKKS